MPLHDHITPLLAGFHRLPVHFSTGFKIFLPFKVLNGVVPSYLTNLLNLFNPKRAVRSSSQMLIVQPRSRLGSPDWEFAVTVLRLWKKLLLNSHTAESTLSFKSRFKTHFFTSAFNLRFFMLGSLVCFIDPGFILIVLFN